MPNQNPLTLQAVKDALRAKSNRDDGELSRLMAAAVTACEQATGRAINRRSDSYSYEDFSRPLTIPTIPVVSVASIDYVNDDTGSSDVLSASAWYVTQITKPFLTVRFNPRVSLPAPVRPGTVRANVVVGDEVVPPGLDQLIVFLVGSWFNAPEGTSPIQLHEVPYSYRVLLDYYKISAGVA